MARKWEAGDLIMGRYRLVSLLGQGGMGSVWRAEHIELKNLVAVKVLDPAIAKNEEMVGRFLREARAAASLKNRHVIQIFDHGVENGDAFMVMELLEGESLGQRLQRGTLPVEETVRFMCQVMRAMAQAHEAGIIHRDLKPDNIFLVRDDEGSYAKVLDFGVAKVGSDLSTTNGVRTQTGMMLGTPYYMSPEQAKAKKVDARTDVWALAVITFECLVGKRPFTGDSFADLVLTLCNSPIPVPSQHASVPMGFDEWFVHATQRDVDRRFRSTREMANELVQLAGAPMTGKRAAPATTIGSVRPGAAQQGQAGAARGSRMSMTTGGAAVGTRTPRPSVHRPSQAGGGSTVWMAAAGLMVLVTGGVGFYAWKTAGSDEATAAAEGDATREEASVSGAEQVDGVDRPGAENSPAADRPEADPQGVPTSAPAVPPPQEAAPAAAPAPSQASSSQAKDAPSSSPAAAKPAAQKTPAEKSAAEKKPAASSPGNTVPVVDNQALPPTEWEF